MPLDHGTFRRRLEERRYFADEGLLTAIRLAIALGRPLLLEGEPGVGKTQASYVLADALERELIRVQCYEGIDVSQVLYEWDHLKQLLRLRSAEVEHTAVGDLYADEFMLERPLLRALRSQTGAVLLIDEIDRADSEFEAFLLEFLDTFQITIPEVGTVSAAVPPLVVLTSNRTRELHDALKRRCLYHWIDHPSLERELQIVRSRAPQVSESLAAQVVMTVQRLRNEHDLIKPPGVAETLDWARALHELGAADLDLDTASASLGVAVKYREDAERVRAALDRILAR
jgi:MoxR-like ATPase